MPPAFATWMAEEAARYGSGILAVLGLTLAAAPLRRAIHRGAWGGAPAPAAPARLLWTAALLPPLAWVGSLWLLLSHTRAFVLLAREDSVMEYGQAILLMVAAVFCARATRSLWRGGSRAWALAYAAATAALIFLFGEEISWAQRIIGVETPEWLAAQNRQREINLHNMVWVDEGIVSVFLAVLPWVIMAALAAWATGLDRLPWLRARLWLPHPAVLPALACVVSYGELYRLYELLYPSGGGPDGILWRVQEPMELVLYAGAAAFFIMAQRAAARAPA